MQPFGMQVPELNVQNGVLKSLSFLFEYIGEMGKDYIYAVTPLLEDALMDRDLVHRQTAASVIQHMALGVAGGCRHLTCTRDVCSHDHHSCSSAASFRCSQQPHHVHGCSSSFVDGCVLLHRPGV
jgi:hypothetical protein